MDTDVTGTSGKRPEIIVAEGDLARRAAELFLHTVREPQSPAGTSAVALSGGSTPRGMYETLAGEPFRDQVPWDQVQIFFSDERFVPPDSPDSNYRLAHETLLSKVPIPDRFVHRVPIVDMTPQEAARLYEEGIHRVVPASDDGLPAFDLIFLGLGPDGHTASLFPGTDALGVTDGLVVANHVPKLDTWRITFTYPLINAARTVVFLVGGKDKASMVARVLAGDDLPAAGIAPTSGRLIWLLDADAAGEIPAEYRAT